MTGDEIVIVERVHKCSFRSGIRTLFKSFPRNVVWNRDEFRAERTHPVDLRFRGGLDHDNGARHARFSRRVGDTLSCISSADRPHATLALGLGQHCHGVGGATQFVRVDRLEVLQLETDVGIVRSHFQTDQRRTHDGVCDSCARFSYLSQFDRPDGLECRTH